MQQSSPQQHRLRSLPLLVFTAAAWPLLLVVAATAAEAPTLINPPPIENALAKPAAGAVAREILEIQRRMGGSIVTDRGPLAQYPPASADTQAVATDLSATFPSSPGFAESPFWPKKTNSPPEPAESLRDAAWQLTLSAERLERCELYKQADAMRKLAQQLRLDARTIRAQASD